LRFSMHVPLGEISGGFQTMKGVAEISAALEAVQIDAANLTDHPAPDAEWLHANGHDALDPFTGLAFIAARTSSVLLHTNIVVLPYRNPFITAKAAATLQTLSDGRLILGVGIGYQQAEFDALGVDFRRRGALTDEALEVLIRTWEPGPVTASGVSFSARSVEPRPVPTPPPPLWIGGGSDRALERAARFGDAWTPFLASPTISEVNRKAAVHSLDDLSEKIQRLHELRETLDKSGHFDIALDLGGQHHPMDRTSSEVARFAELVGQLASMGVTWMFIKPAAKDLGSYVEAVQWYGEEVIPQAKAAVDM
jgi:probable F420-dependent oxidoreductase